MAQSFKKRLPECMARDKDGSLKMTISLPDPAALENMATSLARMASFQNR